MNHPAGRTDDALPKVFVALATVCIAALTGAAVFGEVTSQPVPGRPCSGSMLPSQW